MKVWSILLLCLVAWLQAAAAADIPAAATPAAAAAAAAATTAGAAPAAAETTPAAVKPDPVATAAETKGVAAAAAKAAPVVLKATPAVDAVKETPAVAAAETTAAKVAPAVKKTITTEAVVSPAAAKDAPAVTNPAAAKDTPAAVTPAATKDTPAVATPAATKDTPAVTTPAATKAAPAVATPAAEKDTPAVATPAATKDTPAVATPAATKAAPAVATPAAEKGTPAVATPAATKAAPAVATPAAEKDTPAVATPAATKDTPAAATPAATKDTPAAAKAAPSVATPAAQKSNPAVATPVAAKGIPTVATPAAEKAAPIIIGEGASKATPSAAAVKKATKVVMAPPALIKKREKKANTTVQIVKMAPAVEVSFGDDIDDEGECKDEIKRYCDDIDTEGEGALADCVSDMVAQSESHDADDEGLPDISDECRDELYAFKISRDANINKNIPLAKACQADADKLCNVTWFFGYKVGQVISCLKENKKSTARGCQFQLFKVMEDAAKDIRADPILWDACKDNAATLCKGVPSGRGRVQGCLRDNRMQLSWTCEEMLFRQEVENTDDIRLSVRLFDRCMPDKRKFCADIEPGNARTKDCLEENRPKLSPPCKQEINNMIERRVHDFRLDSKLRDACEDDIFNMCAYFGDLDDIDTSDSSVINCLQDYSEEISKKACLKQVQKYTALAAQDIRFNIPLAEACFEDRQQFCAKIPPGSARVVRCLSNKRDKLSSTCRATLFDEEVRFSENIDFQFPMKSACTKELESFCKGIPHGNARVIRCLQSNKNAKDFGKGCKAEVVKYEEGTAKDYRLNFRLHQACKAEVQSLCPQACQFSDTSGHPDMVCGGKVLRCLTDKMDEVKSSACKKEILYFEKMEVSDFNNDVILAEACRSDVDKFCKAVEAGDGRVHQCLRDHRKELTESCRKEELLLEESEVENIELNVPLIQACKAEKNLYCKSVRPGAARIFRCLAESINDADFGEVCRALVINKLQRRQANWKLDPPLRKACKDDVGKLCAAADIKDSEDGAVYKCLISYFSDVSAGCQKEMGRAVHMAFFVWQEDATLTKDCDDDIKKYCLAIRPNMATRPGAVGSCLASILERQETRSIKKGEDEDRRLLAAADIEDDASDDDSAAGRKKGAVKQPLQLMRKAVLSDKCYVLSDIAEPPNMKRAFETSLSFALLAQGLGRVDTTTGVPLVNRDRAGNLQGISLTGWVATLGLAAMVGLLSYAVVALFKRVTGTDDTKYEMVVKRSNR